MMLGVSHEKNPDLPEIDYCRMLRSKALDDPQEVLFVDWEKVKTIPAFTLPEAVALSLNINPEYAYLPWTKQFCDFVAERTDPNSKLWHERVSALEERCEWDDFNWEHVAQAKIQQKLQQLKEVVEKLSQFETRLHIAERNLAPHGEIKAIAGTDKTKPMVKLIEFSRCAEVKGWQLPNEFPCIKQASGDEEDAPLNTRERKSLLKIVLGMAVAKYRHDPIAERQQNDSAKKISDDISDIGCDVSDDTIRKYLSEAKEFYKKPHPK
jgi:hypothetical protein